MYRIRRFSVIVIIFFIILALIQIKYTDFSSVYSLTPAEIDRQITRMRYYPIGLTRLGYWLEGKKETQVIYVLQKNFIETIDLGTYLPDYFSFIFLPLMLFGLYRFIRINNRLLQKLFFLSIIITTFTGVRGLYGPITMVGFILVFIIIGAKEIFNIIGSFVSRVRPCKSRV